MHSATCINDDEMVVYGGLAWNHVAFDDCWIFNIDKNTWREVFATGGSPPGRYGHSAIGFRLCQSLDGDDGESSSDESGSGSDKTALIETSSTATEPAKPEMGTMEKPFCVVLFGGAVSTRRAAGLHGCGRGCAIFFVFFSCRSNHLDDHL